MIDNVHSTMTRPSRSALVVSGVINKPTTVELCISPTATGHITIASSLYDR